MKLENCMTLKLGIFKRTYYIKIFMHLLRFRVSSVTPLGFLNVYPAFSSKLLYPGKCYISLAHVSGQRASFHVMPRVREVWMAVIPCIALYFDTSRVLCVFMSCTPDDSREISGKQCLVYFDIPENYC